MDLVGAMVRDSRAAVKMTILRRLGGVWNRNEVASIVANLRQPVCEHPQHPEFLISHGAHNRETILLAMKFQCSSPFKYEIAEGLDNPTLPFTPLFI